MMTLEDFSFKCMTDAKAQRLCLTATGQMDSARFIDNEIAACRATGAPWLFDRLIDLSNCAGFIAFEDLERLARYFETIIARAPRTLNTAIVSNNRLTQARMPAIDLLFPRQTLRVFDSRAEAIAWLDDSLSARNA